MMVPKSEDGDLNRVVAVEGEGERMDFKITPEMAN